MIDAQGVPVIPADSLVESIGVNTHWMNHKVYNTSYTSLKIKLGESSIRYIRDGTYQLTCIRGKDLHESLQIGTNILTGRRYAIYSAPVDPTKTDDVSNEIKTELLNATVLLEVPNE